MALKTDELDPQVVEYLLSKTKSGSDLFGDGGFFKQLKKALTERILNGELTDELGYEKHDVAGNNSGNSRNGTTKKTLKTKDGELEINVPRDRNDQYEPKLIAKHQTRFDDLDDKIISLYSRGMTTCDIQDQLLDLYGTEISATLISNVTNEVIEEAKAWQNRPLDKLYSIFRIFVEYSNQCCRHGNYASWTYIRRQALGVESNPARPASTSLSSDVPAALLSR